MYLEIAERYDVSEHRFGIYAQSYVYMEVFMIIDDFYEQLGPES